ncbi:MAG: glutathione S-transferase family protein [Pseudomonadota bacterium]
MRLHFAPGTIAVACALALEEAGVHYEIAPVDFATAAQRSPSYLKTNPKGRVPSLETPQGVLTETGAILEYIADTLAPDLKPKDAFQAAKMREVMFYLASTMHVNHAHKMRGHRWADDPTAHAAMTAKVPETMTASAAFIEAQIEGPYLFGPHPSLADFYLFAISLWLEGDGVDLTALPKLVAFMSAMQARQSKARLQAKVETL